MQASAPSAAKVLIADADPTLRLSLSKAFAALGLQVRASSAAAPLLKWIADADAVLVVLDASRGAGDAFEVLRQIQRARPALPVILTGGGRDLAAAVRAVEAGAFEHFAKPYALDDLTAAAARALPVRRGPDRARAEAQARRDEALPIIGRSPAMQALYRAAARLVGSDLNVLITGETGTGKALVARALHDMGPRHSRPFVALSLAATGPDAVEARLAPDALAQADGGTLFLDAVDDMPPELQARLLDLTADLRPAGAASPGRRPDLRIVAAATRDLRTLIRAGRFREDLYFRLGVAPLTIPPLRARPDDIPDLANAFLRRIEREGLPPKAFDAWAMQRLKAHDWPGNVRELENLVRRLCALYPEPVLTAPIVEREIGERIARPPAEDNGSAALDRAVTHTLTTYFADASAERPDGLYDHILKAVELPLLQATLEATRGNKIRAARILGINRNTLRRKLEDHGLEPAAPSTRALDDRRRIAA